MEANYLQYCSGFCHTLTWISHGFTCIPHPNPPSHLPLYPTPLGLPSAALFIIARTWKQPRCPSADEWMRKLWYIYTVEYYSAIKKDSFESVLMRWMKLEPIIHSEVSQKDKSFFFEVLMLMLNSQLCPNLLWPHGLWPVDFLGRNPGVGGHFLLQGIFATQGSNPCSFFSCIGRSSGQDWNLPNPGLLILFPNTESGWWPESELL